MVWTCEQNVVLRVLGVGWIGFVMSSYAVADVVLSFITGAFLSSHPGRAPTVFFIGQFTVYCVSMKAQSTIGACLVFFLTTQDYKQWCKSINCIVSTCSGLCYLHFCELEFVIK